MSQSSTSDSNTVCKKNVPTPRPRVGVGVFVKSKMYPGHVLLGKRLNKTGKGTWALPGGHVENCETLEETAIREVEEEVGITITNVQVTSFINCFNTETKYHYIVPFLEGYCANDSEPRNMEPNKCEGWHWIQWDNNDQFPKPLFGSLNDIRKSGYSPFSNKDNSDSMMANPTSQLQKNCYFVK